MNENDRILPTSIPDYASSSNLMNREKEDGEEGDEETRSTRKRYYFSLLPPALESFIRSHWIALLLAFLAMPRLFMYSLLATALFTAGYLFHTSQEDVIDRINKFNHRHREIHNLTSNASSSSNKPLQLTALSDKNFAEIPLDDASVPDVVMGRIDQLATHIVEDFIDVWWNPINYSKDSEFSISIHRVIKRSMINLGMLLASTSTNKLVIRSLENLILHLREYRKFERTSTLLETYTTTTNPQSRFSKLVTDAQIISHLQSLSNLICQQTLPKQYASAAISFSFVREILATNILLSIVESLSAPDFINRMIVENFEIPASNSAKSSGSKTAQSANSFWGIELDFDPLEAAGYSSSSKKSSSSTNHRIISNTKGLLTGGSAGDSAKSETDGKQAAPETPSGQHVYVKIVEARRIPTQGLSSSLYCHILCGKESRKTRKIAVDSNPIWLEDFSFNWTEKSIQGVNGVVIDVYDSNFLRDELVGSVYIPKSSLPINRPIKSWHAVDFTDSKLSVKTKATNSHAELSIEVIFIESGLFDHEESSLQQRQQQDGGILQRQQQQHEGSNTQVVAVSPANMMLSSMAILSEESPLNAPTSASDVAQPMSSVPLEISNSTSITTAPPLSQPTSPFKSQSPILLPSTTHAITVYTFNNVLNRQDTFTDVLEFMESTQRGNYIEFLILIKQIGSGLAAKDSTYADLSSLKEDMFNMYRTYLDFEDEAIVSVVHDSDDDDVNDDGTVLRAFIKHQPLVLKELKAMVTICSSSHDDASTELSHHPPPAFSFEEWVSLIKRLESSLVEIMQKLFWTEFCASSYFKTCLIKLQFEKTTTGSSLSKSEAASRISAANLAIPVQNVQTIISSATAREHPATENAIEIISSSVVTSNENTILSAQLPTFNDSATTNNLTKLDEGEELSVISTMENDLESEIVSELIPLALSPDHAVVTTFRKSISGDGRRSRPSSIEEVKNDLPKRPASSSPVRSASSSSTSSSATLTSPTKKDKTQTSPSKKKFFAMFKSKPTAREKVNALTDVFNDDDDEDADHGPWGGSFSNSISSFSNSASTSGENRNENPSAEAAPSMAYMSQEQLNQDEILSYVKGKSTLSPSSPTFKAAVGSASVSGMDSTTSLSSSPSSTTGTVLKDLVGSAESLGSPLISQHDLSANPWSASHSPTTDSDLSNSNFITTPYSIPASSSSSPSKSSTLTLDHTLEMKETMMIQQQQLDNVQNTGGSGMTFLAASIVNLKEQIMILDEQIEALGIGKNKKQVKALIEKKLSLQAQVEQLSEAIADLDARGNGGYIGSQRNSVSISDGTSASAPPFSAEDSSYVNLHKLTVHITDISDEAPVPSETSSSGGGLFKKHELQYIIELQRIDGSMGWIKTRKYTEFQDLNESVCSIFPKVQKMLFPARPRNIHSESGVKTRDKLSVDLTKWLVVLLSDGAICESPPLQEFLRPSSVAAPQGVSASSSTNTTASNVSRSVLGVFKSAGTVMKKVAVGSTKGVVGIVTGVADGLDAAAEVTGLKNAFRGVSDESLKVKDGEENDQIDIDSGDLTRINQKESGRRSQSSTSSSTSPQLPKKEANKHLASMIDSYDVPSIPVRNSSLTSPEGQDLASINGGEGGGTHAIGASRRPSAAEGLLHPSLSCSSTAASSRRNSEAQPEQRPSISKSPERRGGRGSDIHNPQQKSSSGNKKISTSTSNSSSSVSAAELDRDTEIILEGLFGVVEEVFNLNDPNQWIRQKGLQVMKTVLRKAYGPILMNLLRQKSEEYRDQDAVASYICRVTDMFWPGGKWPSSADKASSIAVRSVAEMEETKAKAKQIFISGGVIPVDGLAKLVGRYNCNVGLVKLFNMLQHKDLNRQLVCSMLESIVIGSITDME